MAQNPNCGEIGDVRIRLFQPADLPAVLTGAAEMGWGLLTTEERASTSQAQVARYSEAAIRRALTHPGARVLIAEARGQVIGFEFLVIRADEISGVREALKLGGWVAPRFRRCGVNRMLHGAGEALCRQEGVPRMVAVVALGNEPSMRATGKAGFATEKVIRAKWLQDLPEMSPK